MKMLLAILCLSVVTRIPFICHLVFGKSMARRKHF